MSGIPQLFNEALWQQWLQQSTIDWLMHQFYLYLLVMTRLTGMMMTGPVYSHNSLPMVMRALLAFGLSLAIFPAVVGVQGSAIPLPRTVLNMAGDMGQELLIGFLISFGVMVIMNGIQLAGEMFDQQIGTSIGGLSDPITGVVSQAFGMFLFSFSMFVFVILVPLDGHLMMLGALLETFRGIPVGESIAMESINTLIASLMAQSFLVAVQISAPLLACMTLLTLTVGILGRSVTHIDVFGLGFALRSFLSMLVLVMTLDGTTQVMMAEVPHTLDTLLSFLRTAST